VLLDSCIAGSVRDVLAEAGHDARWSGDWDNDPGDAEILAQARHEGRVLVTLDKDFGELAVLRGAPHSGILRMVNFPARQQASVCLRVLAEYGQELASGAIITAEPGRVRIRLPDSGADR
jgi:predicted nuclease of predicted toxin-antitoxin system